MGESKEYAIIRTGGKQYKVAVGDKIWVEKLAHAVGTEVSFDEVLLLSSASGEVRVGKPTLDGVTVKALVMGTRKGEKIRIYKKQRRTGFTKKQGHRQVSMGLVIQGINL